MPINVSLVILIDFSWQFLFSSIENDLLDGTYSIDRSDPWENLRISVRI